MLKKVLSTILLGATLAAPVTAATLVGGQAQQANAFVCDLSDNRFIEDHKMIDVQTWYFANKHYIYKFKFATDSDMYNGAVQLSFPNSSKETYTVTFWQFWDVINGSKTSLTQNGVTLTKLSDGYYALKIKDNNSISKVNTKFYRTNPTYYVQDGHPIYLCARNTNINAGNPSVGAGFTVSQK